MNRQQEHLYQMLKEIHAICVKNGITYYLAMGSLIGAVRHGGFLPWDDDADIMMTLGEFRRFKEACKTDIPEGRILCSPDEQESYGFLLPRYVSKETTAIHTSQSLHEDICGEVIDIFILDPIADGREAYEAWVQDVNLYSEVRNYANVCSARFEMPRALYDEYAAIRDEKGGVYVSRRLEERLATHFDENGKRYGFRWNGVPITMERSWFAETVLVDFEDTQLMAPKDINGFLCGYYGEEWAQVPGKIVASKHKSASSLEFPYTEALEFYKPSQSRIQLRRDIEERKRICMDSAHAANALADERAFAYAKAAQIELEEKLAGCQESFDAALGAKDGLKLSKILAGYLKAQLSAELSGRHVYKGMFRYLRPIMIDVDDRVFEAALVALMCTERIRNAGRLLEMREWLNMPLTDGMKYYARLREVFQAAVECYQNGGYAQCLEKTEALLDELPQADSFHKLRCTVLLRLAQDDPSEDNLNALRMAYTRGLGLFAGDGFYAKIQADYVWLTGNKEEAKRLYIQAAEQTRNGFALLDIFKKTGYHPTWYRNPAWAHAYGVEQWNGPEPELSIKPAPEVLQGDALQHRLFELLGELCEFCEANGIKYALVPKAAYALLNKQLPVQMQDYAITCAPADAARFIGLANAGSLPADRSLFLRDAKAGAKAGKRKFAPALAYSADDTLCLDMGAVAPSKANGLAVGIKVLQPKKLPPELVGMLGASKKPTGLIGKIKRVLGVRRPQRALDSAASFYEALEPSVGSGDAFFEDAGKFALLPASALAHAAQREVEGTSVRIAADDEGIIWDPSVACGLSLELPKYTVASAVVSYDELVKCGGFASAYFTRKALYTKSTAKARAISKAFNQNFKELKLAVALKELSLELLPQKERIHRLAADNNIEELAQVLAPYIKLAKKYKGAGSLLFDAEIYSALQLVQEKAR